MNFAVLYNVFLCWMVALVSLATTRALVGRKHPTLAVHGLALSWNFAALLWALAGLRLLAYFLLLLTDSPVFMALDRSMFYAGELFLAGQIVTIILFGSAAAYGNPTVNFVLTGFGFVTMLAYLIVLYSQGVVGYTETSWGSEHVLPRASFLVFLPAYLLSLFLIIRVIIREVWQVVVKGVRAKRIELFGAVGFLLYGIAGIVDVRGSWGGPPLLLIRIAYLVAALITFWVARPEDASIRVVHHSEDP
jgi:hypothetical protein